MRSVRLPSPPGLYTVEVVLVGFRSHTAVHPKVDVARVNSSPTFALELDLESEVVVGEGCVSRVHTTNAEVTSIVSNQNAFVSDMVTNYSDSGYHALQLE